MATKEQVLKLVAEKPGWTSGMIARKLNCKDGYVRATIQRANGYKPPAKPKISAAERAEREKDHRDLDMLADVAEGHPVSAVAKHWGVDRNHVRSLIKNAESA